MYKAYVAETSCKGCLLHLRDMYIVPPLLCSAIDILAPRVSALFAYMLHCFYVSANHSDLSRHPSQDSSPTSAMGFSPPPIPSGPVSVFKALYSYDPGQMSPNPNPSSELSLQKGQVLLVFGNMGEVSEYYWPGGGAPLGWVGQLDNTPRAYVCLIAV